MAHPGSIPRPPPTGASTAPAGGAAPDRAHILCVAPMMAWTDRHCRAFHRVLAPHARLYTEMMTADAVLHGPTDRLLAFDPSEHPVALQLGGSDPAALARCAALAAARGFDEVNLNVGCPSPRVQRGAFGACLMREPRRVAACVAAMRDACAVPVTIKCRLGVDGHDDHAFLRDFVDACVAGGADTFAVHARIAMLDGLSPAQNRTVPPLDHDRVRRLKRECPSLTVVVNGGIRDTAGVLDALAWADGVMVGRGAYRNPWWLAELEQRLFGTALPDGPRAALERYVADYAAGAVARGARLHDISRHLLGLFNGVPGARAWRRHLSEEAGRAGAGVEVLQAAADLLLREAA